MILHRRNFFLIGTAGLLAGAAPRPPLAATPIARLDLPWWRARHGAVLRRIRQGYVDLLYIGDSITQDLEKHGPPDWQNFSPIWQRFYDDRNAVNLGFKGDTTANVLWRLRNGEISGVAPKLAIVLIGANNLGRVHWGAEETFAGIEAILAELRQRLPRTKILLLGVLPSERSIWVSETTSRINRVLAARHPPGGDITCMDVTPIFQNDGRLDSGKFYDPLLRPPEPPLHPTAQAAAQMAEAIEPTVAALMGDHRH